MRAVDPADCVREVIGVLILALIRGGRRANLKAGTAKREFVDGLRDAVRWTVDAEIGCGNRRNVQQVIVDVNEAEAEVIDQSRREEMCFVHGEEARSDRNVVGKVEVRRADAA